MSLLTCPRGARDGRLEAIDSRTDEGQLETLGYGVRGWEERRTGRREMSPEKGGKDSQ